MDCKFMREALQQARKGLGRTSPNPAVGAVIVRDGEIIARGYHHKAGLPHAEVEALRKMDGKAQGATLYVTLEPCNHFGRTPPCTGAILESGIKRVVVGMKDPNPEVSGGGCEFLRKNGVEVDTGVMESECRRLNEGYLKFVANKRPFVLVKSALTIDGWTATSTGDSKWITNERSRQFVHRLRNQVDALMVGVGTVLRDDPSLTTRLRQGQGKDPLRVIADTHLRIPMNAKVLNHNSIAQTLLVVGNHLPPEDLKRYENKGVSVLACPLRGEKIDLGALMDILGHRSVMTLLVEGGASIIGSMFRGRLIDKVFIFTASRFLGGDDGVPLARGPGARRIDDCLSLRDVEVRRFGGDILTVGYPDYK
ncbi:MAG: bifunctional diaminohydroxyphosphoribosylaminopyrimidine deaminase/5-amino-6-(5-phosphoribosylamino)uracil reductase RibD [Pseudomonadota bacterium]